MKICTLAPLPPWLLYLVLENTGHVEAYYCSRSSNPRLAVSSPACSTRSSTLLSATAEGIPGKDNKAMSFLRKVGRVGRNTDFTNALGVDEGQSGGKIAGKWGQGTAVKKALAAYKSCTVSGVIDDLSEEFPITCSGTEWAGVTDRVMGGESSGTLARELYHGRTANVLRAHVSLENGGGFVQMATDLALDPSVSSLVDASSFDGIKVELFYQGDKETDNFNVQ
jgi:Complex I intermediate-associated protein 30 (CIA30)